MSLLSRPPHIITVYPVVQVDDGYGGTMPGEGAPIEVRCLVRPRGDEGNTLGGDTDAQGGYSADETYQVTARSLPAGVWSLVVWLGEDWTVTKIPKRHTIGRGTAHDSAVIRRR